MDLMQLIGRLSGLYGPSGLETAVADELETMLEPFADEVYQDAFYNVIAIKKSKDSSAPTLMLDAHIDEVCLMVREIDENGFLRVANITGMDPCALPAADVVVHGKKPLFGVVCCMPPHLQTAEERETMSDEGSLCIDIGLSSEKAKELVAVGDRITWRASSRALADGGITGKALDDRACAAIIVKVMEELQGTELPFHLAALFSAQEEVGCRGAKVGTYRIEPAEAVVLDVSFAMVPGGKKLESGELKGGPMVGVSPLLDREGFERMKRVAEEENIPYQVEVLPRNTGTNATPVQVAKSGVKTALLSLPLRFMHTPVERVAAEDCNAMVRLLTAYLRRRGALKEGAER